MSVYTVSNRRIAIIIKGEMVSGSKFYIIGAHREVIFCITQKFSKLNKKRQHLWDTSFRQLLFLHIFFRCNSKKKKLNIGSSLKLSPNDAILSPYSRWYNFQKILTFVCYLKIFAMFVIFKLFVVKSL